MIRQLQAGWQHPGLLNYLVLPVSWLYRLLVGLRRYVYEAGFKSVFKSTVPVIVVGNLSVGGTGKTPLVIALARYLKDAGRTPGIIARGYGGESAEWPRKVTLEDSASEVGDEPLLLLQSTGVAVAVGPSRNESVALLVDQCGCDVVISDDGFQHFAMARDLDIVVIDSERQLGNGWCLPAGPLREPASGLQRAGIVIFNGAAKANLDKLSALATHNGFSGSTHLSLVVSNGLYRLTNSADRIELNTLVGQRVHAVCGLGNPQRFSQLLTQNDIEHERHFFDDHHRYTQNDFVFVKEGDVIVMTEKDAVKCAAFSLPLNTWVLQISANIPESCLKEIDVVIADPASS